MKPSTNLAALQFPLSVSQSVKDSMKTKLLKRNVENKSMIIKEEIRMQKRSTPNPSVDQKTKSISKVTEYERPINR